MPLNAKQKKKILDEIGLEGLALILSKHQQAESDSVSLRAQEVAHKAYRGQGVSDAFQVFKGRGSNHYWLARHTNNFEDRDKEILSQKAHEAYIARVSLGMIDKPELWAYHSKGTRHGQADEVWMHSGFVFAFGHFDDTPEAQQAIKYYQEHAGEIELSHGFTYDKKSLNNGVYDSYNTFEITTLPKGSASNPYTAFEAFEVSKSLGGKASKNLPKTLFDKQREYIRKLLGDEGLRKAESEMTDKASGNHVTVYKGQRIADDANRLPGGTSAAIERATTIIENTDDRLSDYAKRLKVSPKLHEAFLRILGKDKLEAVYYRSDTNQKALSGSQQVELAFQQARAMGIPEALDTGLSRELGSLGYDQFIEQLMAALFWGASVQPSIKSVSTKSTKKRDKFWHVEIKES